MDLRITSRWEAHGACDDGISHLISIQNPDADVSGLCPPSIAPENHLLLLFDDVDDPDDPRGPKESHVRTLVEWIGQFDREELRGLVVHCDAGVSRSTASAWLALVVLDAATPPEVHLDRVAACSSWDFCWPSRLVTELGYSVLQRQGALSETLKAWKAARGSRV